MLETIIPQTRVRNYTNNLFINALQCSYEVSFKGGFSQKGLMPLSFLQTDEPNYFTELEF